MKKNNKNQQERTRSAERVLSSSDRLVATIQKLSLARDLESIIEIVRKEARQLSGADGATFVLRDGDKCYYVDEDAIEPLWKDKRFPMEACISGWAMLNRQSVGIEDIYSDSRIPADAYRPTFVKSLLMVPIRSHSPIGAIGNYWATHHKPSDDEIKHLQALADSTSIAMENVELYSSLKKQLMEYENLSKRLQSSLNEKEILLKEVYHRVKNNLQVVSSLLNLQASTLSDPFMKSCLTDSIKRIASMSLVHEMLYRSDNMESISLRDYVHRLINYTYKIAGPDVKHINSNSNIDDITVSLEYAIPCGLIINELISNVFKHAFPERRSGEISISIRKHGETVTITVKDDGVGLPDREIIKGKNTLGLNLVEKLASQIRGNVAFKSGKGTEVDIVFPYRA